MNFSLLAFRGLETVFLEVNKYLELSKRSIHCKIVFFITLFCVLYFDLKYTYSI